MIKEIKDIKKLQTMVAREKAENKYLKECCMRAGKELEKHSFKWDGKEKNLVVQALGLNGKYEKLNQCLKEIKELANENKDTAQYRGICRSILYKISECIGVEE